MNKGNGKNLIVRTLSGAVLLAVVLVAVLWSEYSFALLLGVICVGALREFYALARKTGANPQTGYGIFLGLAAVGVSFYDALEGGSMDFHVFLLPLVFAVFIVELYRKQKRPLENISVTLGGLIYVAVPLSLLCYLATRSWTPVVNTTGVYQPQTILAYIFLVWANDIGAYLAGVTLGRHKLFERISPKKTWEGFFGGLVATVALGVVISCSAWSGAVPGVLFWVGLAVTVVVSGVFGDLAESLFKRSAGVKDSGAIMPGHGGFLDRFDALILSAPFVFVYFIIFANAYAW